MVMSAQTSSRLLTANQYGNDSVMAKATVQEVAQDGTLLSDSGSRLEASMGFLLYTTVLMT